MLTQNPFTPMSGSVPSVWAGRELILTQIKDAIASGFNNPYLSTLLAGPRGTGKSSLLNFACQVARENGWITSYCLADKDLLQTVLNNASFDARTSLEETKISINESTIAGIIGFDVSLDTPAISSFDTKLNEFVSKLASIDVGLLIAIDEVNPDVEEMKTLVFSVQKLQAQGHKIALFMSGLPEHIDSLLDGKSTSYLRRSMKYYTSFVADEDVANTLQKTAKAAGKHFSKEALQRATLSIGGYPYLIQFVGYWCFLQAGDATEINTEMVKAALKTAIYEYEKNVLDQALKSLSVKDIAILKALSKGPMTQTDLAKKLGKSRGYLSVYKKRLLDRGLIEQSQNKQLGICLPHLASYVETYDL